MGVGQGTTGNAEDYPENSLKFAHSMKDRRVYIIGVEKGRWIKTRRTRKFALEAKGVQQETNSH